MARQRRRNGMAVCRAGAAGRRRRVQVFSTVDNDIQINREAAALVMSQE